MSSVNHYLIVSGRKPPVVEFDPLAWAIYVRFSSRRISKTLEKECSEAIPTVDLDRSGGVVGVEAIGFTEFTIAKLLKAANVRADGIDFSQARFRGTPSPRQREPVSA